MAALGERLRTTRRAHARTLKDIARKTGFTEAYLSQVETGRASPSLAALKRIAAGYGLSVVDLVADDPPDDHSLILRAPDRRRLVLNRGGIVKELLVARQADKRMEPLQVTIRPGVGSGGQYDHAGEEFGVVLSGALELTVETKTFRIGKGDAFYFRSTRLHGFRNPSRRHNTTVLWVITPPSF
jgi:transcriptional regulator with XRE-family HTH domain